MSIFYKMLMFTEALCVYVNPLIYQIKNTFFNKVKKKELKKQLQRDNQRNSEKSCVTQVGQTL